MSTKTFNIFVAFLCMLFFSNFLFAEDLEQIKINQKINRILIEADENHLSNKNQFNLNLAQLTTIQKNKKFTKQQECYLNYLKIYNFVFEGNHQEAMQRLESIFNECDEIVLKIRARAMQANLSVISNKYESAINYLDYALKNILEIKNTKIKQVVYLTASLVYRLIEQYDLSLKFSNLLIVEDTDPDLKCKALISKYRSILQQESFENYEKEIQNAIYFCKTQNQLIHSNFLLIEWLDKKIDISKNNTDLELILAQLKSSENQINKVNYQNLISVKNSVLAKIYWKLGSLQKASEFAQKSIDESKSIGNVRQNILSYQILADYNKNIGNENSTIEYLKKINQLEKIKVNDKMAKYIAYQSGLHNNFANEQEIKFLNQENKLLALENNLSEKSAQIQKLVILLLIAVTGFFVLWGLWQRRSQRIYKKLSERDHMTSIFNRNGLRKYTESLLAYSKENDTQVGCAIFDLDWFKKINDQFGHATGDWTIKNVIKKCESLGNKKATFGRLGGEEFAIILSDANKEEMYIFCESCRNAINSLVTKESGHQFKISASFGMTTSDVSKLSYSDLLIHADDALYKAKNSGRNNTVIYQPNT